MEAIWDQRKERANIRKHGVDFSDAAVALEDEYALTVAFYENEEQRYKTLAASSVLGVLLIIHPSMTVRRFGSLVRERPTVARDSGTTKVYLPMTDEFKNARRGPVIPPDPSKVRITIRLDPEVINYFKDEVSAAGGGNYQTLMNNVLRDYVEGKEKGLDRRIRKIVREELKKAS